MKGNRPLTATAGWGALLVLTALPVTAIVVQAFTSGWFFPDLVPTVWEAATVWNIVGATSTREGLVTGLLVGVVATAVAVTVAIPAARSLVLGRRRHARLIVALFLVPTVLPPVALAMGLNVALLRAEVAGTFAAVVLAHLVVVVPYAVLILAAALTRYDATFERQALALGARSGRVLWTVFLPLARPAIGVTAVLAFLVSWSQYLLTLLPGGGRVTTLPVLLLAASNGGNPTATAALAVITSIPPAVAVLLVVRHLDGLGGQKALGRS